jgi:cytochrome c biogenesis factor
MVKEVPNVSKPELDSHVRQNYILILSLTLVLLVFMYSIVYYKTVDRKLMAENIEAAIAKSIDPLAVRCSYANSDDNICVAYAISNKSIDAPKR